LSGCLSTRSSHTCKNLRKIRQGFPTGIYQDVHPISSDKDLYKIKYGARLAQPFCASQRSQHAHGPRKRIRSCENLQRKCRGPKPGPWPSHNSNVSRIYGGNAVAQNLGAHFVRACAVEIHMDISQDYVHARIYREKAEAQDRESRRSLCASQPGQPNAHGYLTRVFYCVNLRATCHAPTSGRSLCTSLRDQTAHGHLKRNFGARI